MITSLCIGFLLLIVLNINNTLATRVRIRGKGESNRGLRSVWHPYQKPSESVAVPRHETLYPEYVDQPREIYSSSSFLVENSEIETFLFERETENYKSSNNLDLMSLIDQLPFSINEPIPTKPEVSIMLNEIMHDALASLFPGERIQFEQRNSYKNNHNTLNKLTMEEQAISNKIELVEGSKVFIDRTEIERLTDLHKYNSRALAQRILEELIPIKELATLEMTNRRGYKEIPEYILKTVETYVAREAEPKMNHEQFRSNIRYQIKQLRKKKIGDRKSKLEEEAKKSPSNPVEMVELAEGIRGVMIPKSKYDVLIAHYSNEPRKLLKEVLSELMPIKELATSYATNNNEQKSIPIHIRDAVEVFINNVAEPKMTHTMFMTVLGNHLRHLSNVFKMDKIHLKNELKG